ncbi:hypothetical protein [Rubellimicrobium roseum]|uniref:Uncharacterized protein n=1 Tax=Rubellimicrobium roseum TaxID=687525 RepID=A0A5C4NFK8_9RHOB|nr:hypothetical protein [Rubellimicrobium roseum]TNC71417.1 hypothetical protein FHG71_11725 [Rubellimicrobium roseum]
MSLLLNVILSLAFVGALGGAVQYWRVQVDAARRDALQAMAARRGWALTVTGTTLGRAGTLRLVPRGGHPWVLEVRPGAGPERGPVTDYESDEPRWAEGTLVLVAARLDHLVEAPSAGSDPIEGTPGRLRHEQALRDLLGRDLARLAATLPQQEAPEGVTVFAEGPLARRLDLQDLARALQAWTPVAKGPRGVPILVLSPEGMRLRLRHPVQRADRMERFVDLALDLARLIGP